MRRMSKKWRWINIFVRDLILSGLLIWANFTLDFQSWFAACVMGMILVLMAWHLQDLIKERRLDYGSIGWNNSNRDSPGIIHNGLLKS